MEPITSYPPSFPLGTIHSDDHSNTSDVWTPAVKDALSDAQEAINDSQKLRRECTILTDDITRSQTQLRERVHEQMVQKIAQTATLVVRYCIQWNIHVLHYWPTITA